MHRTNLLPTLVPLVVLTACGGRSLHQPVPQAWQGTYVFAEAKAFSAQDREMVGTAFRLGPEQLVFEGPPTQPFFDDMPLEWQVVGWEVTEIGLATLELRAGESGMGLGFIGEPAGPAEKIEVSFTFTVKDDQGETLRVRGGPFEHGASK